VSDEPVNTGISKLDKELGGGFAKGQSILLAGNPGSGKTTFGVQFLYSGLVKGETVIYVSFCEPRTDFMKYMESVGFFLRKYESENKFFYLEALTLKDQVGVQTLVEKILETTLENNATRIVIDSLSVLEMVFDDDQDVRAFLHNTLLRTMKSTGLTSVLITDLPYGETKIGFGIEEFVFDGVMLLHLEIIRGLPRRKLTIKKFRAKDLPFVDYDVIMGNGGLILVSPLATKPEGKIGGKKFSTGIEGLDEMLDGGLREGTVTIIAGPSGSGKTQCSLQYILEGAKNDELTLFLSFDESEEQVRGHMLNIASFDQVYKALVISQGTLSQTPYYLVEDQRQLINNLNPTRIVIDGIDAFRRVYGDLEFYAIISSLISLYKEKGVTAIFTSIKLPSRDDDYCISILADNIITIDFQKYDFKLSRRIGVIKARGTNCSTGFKDFRFAEGGKIIVEK
jgi:circadian clock protein KaiC